ncbi:hypothetical protein [Kribbella sp. NPDC051770]|uniref:hypothetical protein n=1 Tax=Kribbella sp. NPDC051770 TaxID=3155413 RepID=UPI0034437D3E
MIEPAVHSAEAEAVRTTAVRLWPALLRTLTAARPLTSTGLDAVRNHTFGAVDEHGRALTVRLDGVPLPAGERVRVFANTTSDNHVIQLSDQLTPEQVGPMLAWGAAELMAVRRRADAGVPPVRRDLLDGAVVGVEGDPAQALLSESDYAALGRLDWLAGQAAGAAEPERVAARDAFSAELDRMGLRPEQDSKQRAYRLLVVDARLGAAGRRLLHQLNRPLEELSPADADALRRHRAEQAASRSTNEPAAPGVQRPVATRAALSAEELAVAARQAAVARDQHSMRTIDSLRKFAADLPSGQLPKVRLMIGGGAALAGREADVLLVDGRGRWHVDPIPGIVQSADQVRQLRASGLGDPYDVTGPRERVPLTAIQLWEDQAAARGPLIDGTAELAVDASGRLVADISPLDGSAPIRIEVDGTPVVATGVPAEIIPGVSRWVPTVPEALTAIDGYLATAQAPHAEEARQALSGLRDAPGTAAAALARLEGVSELTDLRNAVRAGGIVGASLDEALTTLEATAAWDDARQQLPGRVLIGDEIGDGDYDPQAGKRWLIAGIGGGAIANAEIILAGNPDAEVVMVGGEAPWVLQNDAQYTAMRQQHDKDFNPEASGRLQTISGKRLGAVATARTDDGRTVVRMLDSRGQVLRDTDGQPLQGDVYVGCLGRVARTPRVLDGLRAWAQETRGELRFSSDRQYLGYQVQMRNGTSVIDVEVTGAASRLLPADLFDAATAAMVNEHGLVEAPPESGNVAAGFMATALQAKHRTDDRNRSSNARELG